MDSASIPPDWITEHTVPASWMRQVDAREPASHLQTALDTEETPLLKAQPSSWLQHEGAGDGDWATLCARVPGIHNQPTFPVWTPNTFYEWMATAIRVGWNIENNAVGVPPRTQWLRMLSATEDPNRQRGSPSDDWAQLMQGGSPYSRRLDAAASLVRTHGTCSDYDVAAKRAIEVMRARVMQWEHDAQAWGRWIAANAPAMRAAVQRMWTQSTTAHAARSQRAKRASANMVRQKVTHLWHHLQRTWPSMRQVHSTLLASVRILDAALGPGNSLPHMPTSPPEPPMYQPLRHATAASEGAPAAEPAPRSVSQVVLPPRTASDMTVFVDRKLQHAEYALETCASALAALDGHAASMPAHVAPAMCQTLDRIRRRLEDAQEVVGCLRAEFDVLWDTHLHRAASTQTRSVRTAPTQAECANMLHCIWQKHGAPASTAFGTLSSALAEVESTTFPLTTLSILESTGPAPSPPLARAVMNVAQVWRALQQTCRGATVHAFAMFMWTCMHLPLSDMHASTA